MFYDTESNNLIDQEFCGQNVKTRQLKYLKWLNQFAVSMDVYPYQRISIIAQFSFDMLQFNIGNCFWHSVRKKIIPLFPIKKSPLPFLPFPLFKKIHSPALHNFFFCNLLWLNFVMQGEYLSPTSSHRSYS